MSRPDKPTPPDPIKPIYTPKEPTELPSSRPEFEKEPVKSIETPIRKPKPVEFDKDSYPIWYSIHSFTFNGKGHEYLYFLSDSFMVTEVAEVFNIDKQLVKLEPTVNLPLNLSSKLKLHGISIYYHVSNTSCYISSIRVSPTGGAGTIHSIKDLKLNHKNFSLVQFIVPEHSLISPRPYNLELELHFNEKTDSIHISGVGAWVKDI